LHCPEFQPSSRFDFFQDKLAAVTAQVEEETHRREAASDEAKKWVVFI